MGELKEEGSNSPEWKIVKLCMNLKLIDARKVNSKLEGERYKMRKTIEDEYGKNSRRSRNTMKNLGRKQQDRRQ